MTYKEDIVENLLVRRIDELGGVALKLQPPPAGIPDRLVLLPGGRMYFIELKRPGEGPRKLQVYWLEKLLRMGFEARVLDSKEAVREFVRGL